MSRKRVVITSASLISPCGSYSDTEIFKFKPSEPTPEMRVTGLDKNREVPVYPVQDFDLKSICGRNKNRRYLSRASSLLAGAALHAISASRLKSGELESCGFYSGAGPFLEQEAENPQERRALWLLGHLPNTAASFVTITAGLKGESLTVGTACAASLQAIGTAYRAIRNGDATRIFAGGGDSRLSENALNGYARAGALYSRNDAGSSYSPLREEPCGFVPGEGAAFFLLEEREAALKRGAVILAEINGFAATADAVNMTAPDPEAAAQKRAVMTALEESGMPPGEIGRISLHGTGTPLNDAMECKLITELFELTKCEFLSCLEEEPKAQLGRPLRINAHKRVLGHLASACGAAELALELAHAQQNPCGPILLENFGFGGQNAVLIITPSSRESSS